MAKNRHTNRNKKSTSPFRLKRLYSIHTLSEKLFLSRDRIRAIFPRASVAGRGSLYWYGEVVREVIARPEVAREIERGRERARKDLEETLQVREYLGGFGTERLRRQAMTMERRFVLHIGPTNSGKTYQARQALMAARNGVYLGPLRLLALEMFDTLNRNDVPCSLITGEESIEVFSAEHTASTIELADYTKHYEVAVIDEAQLITDPYRGDKWLRAIYCIDADSVHVCLAPEAEQLIRTLLSSFGAPYTVVRHERLAPLEFAGSFRSIGKAQPGDALIVFSRRAVLAVSAELQRQGIPSAVIYGALPPVSRREEVRRFTQGEAQVVVATDAIGMGVSLPIKRIIFCETTKFDGQSRRPLTSGEIKQVAGRAGRYGIFDKGEVLTMAEEDRIRDALTCVEPQHETVMIPFPEEAFVFGFPPEKLLTEWNALPAEPGTARVDMSEALILWGQIRPFAAQADRRLLYRLITCPVDTGDDGRVEYWLSCCRAILLNRELPEPPSGTDSLEECEARYRELDIRHQLLRQIGVEEDRMAEKTELCEKINRFLEEGKDTFVRRCRICGRHLPATATYSICEKCHRTGRAWRG